MRPPKSRIAPVRKIASRQWLCRFTCAYLRCHEAIEMVADARIVDEQIPAA
jgi:hypothetical protein